MSAEKPIVRYFEAGGIAYKSVDDGMTWRVLDESPYAQTRRERRLVRDGIMAGFLIGLFLGAALWSLIH